MAESFCYRKMIQCTVESLLLSRVFLKYDEVHDFMADEHQVIHIASLSPSVLHPLEPLTAEEITIAVSIIRNDQNLSEHFCFISVNLLEPAKAVVLNFKAGDAVSREAFVVLLDKSSGSAYEAIVSITEERVKEWRHIP